MNRGFLLKGLLIGILLIVIVGAYYAYQNRYSLLLKVAGLTQTKSAVTLDPSSSWKSNVKNIIVNRADLHITASGVSVELTPLEGGRWHVVITSSQDKETQESIHVVSKKMNIDISASGSGIKVPLSQQLNIDTTMTDDQLMKLINTLPGN